MEKTLTKGISIVTKYALPAYKTACISAFSKTAKFNVIFTDYDGYSSYMDGDDDFSKIVYSMQKTNHYVIIESLPEREKFYLIIDEPTKDNSIVDFELFMNKQDLY